MEGDLSDSLKYIDLNKVKIIEEADLDISERKNLLLVYAKVKPAAILDIRETAHPSKTLNLYELSEDYVTEITSMLDYVGVFYKVQQTEIVKIVHNLQSKKQINLERMRICIGKNRPSLERMLQAETDYDYGIGWGYPKTAVQAFVDNRSNNEYMLNQLKKEWNEPAKDYLHFLCYTPSKEHFEEDILPAKIWCETFKQLSPKLYREIVEFHCTKHPQNIRKYFYTSCM